jgi:hypothetical protein
MGGLFDDLYLILSYYLLVVLHVCVALLYAVILCMYSYLYICIVALSFIELRLVVEKWGVDRSASWTRSKLKSRILDRS